jgi:NAD(P)-dependent dehydrogenase (short-subunit alcohol dehydrogenase family)
MQLERKRMIVTGGASGIAAATVLAYAREGAAVVSLDIDDDAGRAVVDEAAGLGPGPITWPASSSRCRSASSWSTVSTICSGVWCRPV